MNNEERADYARRREARDARRREVDAAAGRDWTPGAKRRGGSRRGTNKSRGKGGR